jgi:hypothetical protein
VGSFGGVPEVLEVLFNCLKSIFSLLFRLGYSILLPSSSLIPFIPSFLWLSLISFSVSFIVFFSSKISL